MRTREGPEHGQGLSRWSKGIAETEGLTVSIPPAGNELENSHTVEVESDLESIVGLMSFSSGEDMA